MAKPTVERDNIFFTSIAEGLGTTKAARAAGYTPAQCYARSAENASFALRWKEAKQEWLEALEEEADRRAFHGTEKPVGWHQGVAGGEVTEYSDTLLIFRLKALDPETYRERSEQKLRGDSDNPVHTVTEQRGLAALANWSDEDLMALHDLLGKNAPKDAEE